VAFQFFIHHGPESLKLIPNQVGHARTSGYNKLAAS
jgi:hypothetical protein